MRSSKDNRTRPLPARGVVFIFLTVVIIAVASYFARNSVSKFAINSFLGKEAVLISNVSIESMSIYELVIADLALDSAKDSEIFSSEAASLGSLLDSLLNLPEGVPFSSVQVARISHPNLPLIEDAHWSTDGADQSLRFRIADYQASVSIARGTPENVILNIQAASGTGEPLVAGEISLDEEATGYTAQGSWQFNAGLLRPLLTDFGVLPQQLKTVTGTGTTSMEASIPRDADQIAAFETSTAFPQPILASYAIDAANTLEFSTVVSQPVIVTISYPSLSWAASSTEVQQEIEVNDIGSIGVNVTEVACNSDASCSITATARSASLQFNQYTITDFLLNTSLDGSFSDQISLLLDPRSAVSFETTAASVLESGSFQMQCPSGSTAVFGEHGWSAGAAVCSAQIKMALENRSLWTDFTARLTELQLNDGAAESLITINAATATNLVGFGEHTLIAPDIAGQLSVRGDMIAASLSADRLDDSIASTLEATFNLAAQIGEARIAGARADFSKRHLSGHLENWANEWDILGGRCLADAMVNWSTAGEQLSYSGTATLKLSSLDGAYSDIGLTGLTGSVNATFNDEGGMTIKPFGVLIDLVDVGVPVQAISARIVPVYNDSTMTVTGLEFAAFDGRLHAEPFSYDWTGEATTIMLHAETLPLQAVVRLIDVDDLTVSGSVSGIIPVGITNNSVTVSDGQLASDNEGGVIRYLSANAAAITSQTSSDLGVVGTILNNFHFKALKTGVAYDTAGNLQLDMRLEGLNPDMDSQQPVILNLSVENNVPDLLRSLQATRSVTDVIDNKLGN